jgi:hypothetical protein
MSVFEFVYGFMSIVTSLAVAHLFGGFVQVMRNVNRVRFSLPHLLWAWCAFTSTIGNWASSWSERTLNSWPAWSVLLTLSTASGQYVFCAFVTPDAPKEGAIDLVAFHQQKRAGYLWAFFALGIAAVAYNLGFGLTNHYADWMRDTLLTLPLFATILLAIFVRSLWVQTLSAAAAAALQTYFLIAASNISP